VNVTAVPPGVAPALRAGIRIAVFGSASEEMAQLSFSERPREDYELAIDRHSTAMELLDQVGWESCGAPAEIVVDLDRYGSLVLEGLQATLANGQEDAEGDQEDLGIDPLAVADFLRLVQEGHR
jgi:hypothetical protein